MEGKGSDFFGVICGTGVDGLDEEDEGETRRAGLRKVLYVEPREV